MATPRARRPLIPADRRAWLTAYAEDHELELLFFDPPDLFDAAILGVVYGFNQEPAVLYDEACILAAFVRDGMSEEGRGSSSTSTPAAPTSVRPRPAFSSALSLRNV